MGDGPARVFKPEGMRILSFNRGGTKLDKDAYACLDCGLVWTFTQTAELRKFIQKHCD
jgi:hypothetical protein